MCFYKMMVIITCKKFYFINELLINNLLIFNLMQKLREDAPVIIGKPPSKEAVQLVRKEPATPKRSQFDIDALFGDISDKKDDLVGELALTKIFESSLDFSIFVIFSEVFRRKLQLSKQLIDGNFGREGLSIKNKL